MDMCELLEYLRGVMESIYTMLALKDNKNECAVFLPISEVCNGTVSLTKKNYPSTDKYSLYNKK